MSKSNTDKQKRFQPLAWFLRHWGKLTIVCTVFMGSYGIYLDAQIQAKFGGNKWQVPAQVFARPMTLKVNQEISSQELISELEILGYRESKNSVSVGEYSDTAQSVTFFRRAFEFSDGFEPQQEVQVRWKGGRIESIEDLKRNQQLTSARLEPWLITRLVSTGREDRMLVNLEDIPESLVQGLILTEDKDFYRHHGIAPLSIARALLANIAAGRTVQGGSTLTQQLVKNLFLTREKSISRKIKEALMSLLIEWRYEKDEILETYLNEVFLGQNGATGVHGFGLASHFYFGRPINELDVAEVATLVGIIKGPSYYNPKRYPKRAEERRNLVLRFLFEHGHLQRQEYQKWVNQPVTLSTNTGLATGKHPGFMDKVRRELKQVLDNPDIRESGVKVFTTMDPLAQRRAEETVISMLPKLEKSKSVDGLEAAVVITDIDTGELRAMVGGRNTRFRGFNRALDARRSIGSLIKPAIYLTALEQATEYNLATPLEDKPISLKSTYGKMWQPHNADKKFRGDVALLNALTGSLNVPTVGLGMRLGLGKITDTIQRLGVDEPLEQYPALTLGAANLSPIQVNQMYQTIANEGRYVPLHALRAVTTSSGEVLWESHMQPQQRADEKAIYLVNYALHKVTKVGTAKSLKSTFPKTNMAGKTGTTDDYRDSWFSGFDKNILMTVWLGKDNNESTQLTGASGALQLFSRYQTLQHPKSLSRRFPQGLGIAHFDAKSGRRIIAGCENSISVPAILDALPSEAQSCSNTEVPSEKKGFWERLFGD